MSISPLTPYTSFSFYDAPAHTGTNPHFMHMRINIDAASTLQSQTMLFFRVLFPYNCVCGFAVIVIYEFIHFHLFEHYVLALRLCILYDPCQVFSHKTCFSFCWLPLLYFCVCAFANPILKVIFLQLAWNPPTFVGSAWCFCKHVLWS